MKRSPPSGRFAAMRAGVAVACAFAVAAAPSAADSGNAAFGVMVHYLPDRQSVRGMVDIDVEAAADALAAMRASYLILTLGQNNGQYVAPNAALEALCPASVRQRPPRDLAMDLAQALNRRGIQLVLYLPFRAPQGDAYLMNCLGDRNEQQPPPQRFIAAWAAVIRDWSDRYGPSVTGWWFDGTYNTSGMTAADWNLLCGAALSGATSRWIAFNGGEGPARFSARFAPCQNMMAGELMHPGVSLKAPVSSMRFHVLTPLGDSWSTPSAPRFDARQIRQWIADAKSAQGSLTLDLPVDTGFRFLPSHVAVVRSATAP